MKKNLNHIEERPATAITYLRVSSAEQVQNFSLGNQEKVCSAFAERQGWKMLKTFKEEGESAKTADRTALGLLLSYLEKNKGKVGYLVIARLDRLNRNIADFYILKSKLEKLGVAIMSATENIGQNAEGVLLEAVIAGVAQFDNITRSRKTIEGMKARMTAGYWPTVAPIGYLNGVDSEGKRNLLVDPDKSVFIRMLYEDYAKGVYTFTELAKKYKDKLWSRKKIPMYEQRVAQILKNPAYCGRIEKPAWGISVQGKFPPLIPETLFYKAQSIMEGNAPSRKQPRSRFNDLFPLRGIKCGVCDRHMTGGSNTGKMKSKKYHYYSCGYRHCPARRTIRKDDLEDSFSSFLEEHAPSEEFLSALREAVRLAYSSEMDMAMQRNKDALKKLDQLKLDKKNILGLMVREPALVDDLKDQLARRTEEIRQMEAVVAEEQEDFDVEQALDFAIDLIQNLHQTWKSLGAKELSVLRKILFPQNVAYHYPVIQTRQLSIIYLLNQQFMANGQHQGCLMGIGPT